MECERQLFVFGAFAPPPSAPDDGPWPAGFQAHLSRSHDLAKPKSSKTPPMELNWNDWIGLDNKTPVSAICRSHWADEIHNRPLTLRFFLFLHCLHSCRSCVTSVMECGDSMYREESPLWRKSGHAPKNFLLSDWSISLTQLVPQKFSPLKCIALPTTLTKWTNQKRENFSRCAATF